MPAALFDVEPLLAPLQGDAPCGPELDGGDAEFLALELASTGKPERQYGAKVYPAEPPDWEQVYELSLGLLQRSRDLRLAVWLTRSGARLLGMEAAARGLQLVHGLLEQQWGAVHPQLDASDHDDPTMRMNALAALAASDALLLDLRAATLAPVRGSLTLRELELGLGKDEAHGDEPRPTEAGVLQALQTLAAAHPQSAPALRGAAASVQAIGKLLDQRAGSVAPDLAPLRKLLSIGTAALAQVQGEAAAPEADATAPPASPADVAAAPAATAAGSLRTRADAIRELERVCDWIERNEPSHPAPLLIRRAQRLMKMSFIEIIQDMAPGAFDQVQTITGAQPE